MLVAIAAVPATLESGTTGVLAGGILENPADSRGPRNFSVSQ